MPTGSYDKLYLLHFCHGNRHLVSYCNFKSKHVSLLVINPAADKKKSDNPHEFEAFKNAFDREISNMPNGAGLPFEDWSVISYMQFRDLKEGLQWFDKETF